jgi:hypothetical protein
VGVNGVGGETDQLDTTLGELWLELGEGTELSGADWGVVLWVREEDNPVVTDELMEVDWAVGGVGLEVWGNGAEAETMLQELCQSMILTMDKLQSFPP